MKLNYKNIAILSGVIIAAGIAGQEAAAQSIDFGKAENAGNQVIAFLRGPLATIVLVLAFCVAGFLAAMNRISWLWVGGIILAAIPIFGGPAFVDNLRSILS